MGSSASARWERQWRVIAALLDSPIGPALSRKLDKIEADHYTPSFKLSLMRKDLRLVLAAAERRGVELKLVQDAAGWIEQAEQHGLGGYDYSAVVAQIRGERPPAEQVAEQPEARSGHGCLSDKHPP